MVDASGNMLAQLEAAIAAWNARAGKAHHGVLSSITESRARLNSVARLLDVQRTVSASLITARASLDALDQSPEEGRRKIEAAISSVAELGMFLGTFERALGELLDHADATVRSGDQLMEKLLSLRGEGASMLSLAPDDLDAYETESGRVALPSEREATLQNRVQALREEVAEVRQAYADLKAEETEALAAARQEADELRERVRELEAERERPVSTPAASPAPSATELQPGSGGDRYDRILANAVDERGQKRRMGQILVDAGVISQDQLDDALLVKQSKGNRHLGRILVERGYTSHTTIAQALAAQTKVPFIRLRESNIDPRALRAISPNLATRHTCIPFHVDMHTLSVAMANPLDLIALDDLRLAVRQHVQPYAAASDEIEDAIRRHYRQP